MAIPTWLLGKAPKEQTEENGAALGTGEIKAGPPQRVSSQMLCIVALSANTASQRAGNQRLALLS